MNEIEIIGTLRLMAIIAIVVMGLSLFLHHKWLPRLMLVIALLLTCISSYLTSGLLITTAYLLIAVLSSLAVSWVLYLVERLMLFKVEKQETVIKTV